MSGHSHWSTIKRKKEVADQKRGQIFSKITRSITMAAKDNPYPDSNFKLRLAIDQAKQMNMPKENIERALKKAQGSEGGERLVEMVYEGYGPGQVAILVECLTDNKNRTASEIKKIFERKGGSLVDPGAVAYQFKKVGLITVSTEGRKEERMLKLMDLPIEDLEEGEEEIEVYVQPRELVNIKTKIEELGLPVVLASLVSQPTTKITITDKDLASRVLSLMEELDNHEDVQSTFANFDIQVGGM